MTGHISTACHISSVKCHFISYCEAFEKVSAFLTLVIGYLIQNMHEYSGMYVERYLCMCMHVFVCVCACVSV